MANYGIFISLNEQKLQQYYSSIYYKNAWDTIKSFFANNGFRPKQEVKGTGLYVSDVPVREVDIFRILDNMKNEYPWIQICNNHLQICTIGEWIDVNDIWYGVERKTASTEDIIKQELQQKVQQEKQNYIKAHAPSEHDSQIYKNLIQEEKLNDMFENAIHLLEQNINKTTYQFQTSYEEVKGLPEFEDCFTEEGKQHNNSLNIVIDYRKKEIVQCEQTNGNTSEKVSPPKLSEFVIGQLVKRAKQMIELKDNIEETLDEYEMDI